MVLVPRERRREDEHVPHGARMNELRPFVHRGDGEQRYHVRKRARHGICAMPVSVVFDDGDEGAAGSSDHGARVLLNGAERYDGKRTLHTAIICARAKKRQPSARQFL